jgi:succinate dehydrogenase / fumarate reductase flavoprotein subunit
MWERCGVVRDDAGLRDGLSRLDEIRAIVGEVDVRPSAEGWADLAQLIDLQAGLLVAEATLKGALLRRESRGCHNRTDFPALDPALQVNFNTRLDDGRLTEPWSEAVPAIRDELLPWLEQAGPADMAGRLLE